MERTLTRQEAINEMKKGNKITHFSFTENEWITMKDGMIVTEEGYKCKPFEFWVYRQLEMWNTNYSIYKK